MPTREHGRTERPDAMNPAARAFLSLSGDGTAELDSRSARKSVAAVAIMFLVLLAAPLYWASHSQARRPTRRSPSSTTEAEATTPAPAAATMTTDDNTTTTTPTPRIRATPARA